MRNSEFSHAEDIIQPLDLPAIKLLERRGGSTATTTAKATSTATSTTTVTATAAVKAATTTTATAITAAAAATAHTEDLGGNVDKRTRTDKGRVGSVKLHGRKTGFSPAEGSIGGSLSVYMERYAQNSLHESRVDDTAIRKGGRIG